MEVAHALKVDLRRFVFPGVVIVFVLLRVLSISTETELLINNEELLRGTIAKEMNEGLRLPIFEYQADGYDGGSLVVAAMAAPLFIAFGANIFVLKLVPLMFSLGTLLALIYFLRRFFSERAAIYGALLFIFSPPVFTIISLYAVGILTEALFFCVLALVCFYKALFEDLRTTVWLGIFGIVSGFAFWFTAFTLLFVLACLISWFFIDRSKVTFRNLVVVAVCFVVGAAPWFYYNAIHDYSGLEFILGTFQTPLLAGNFSWSLFTETPRFLLKVLPLSLGFDDALGLSGDVLSQFFYFSAVVGVLLSTRSLLKKEALPLVIYIAVFLLAYGVSRYHYPQVGFEATFVYRHYVPLYLMIFIFCAVALSKLPRLGTVFMAVLILLGCLGQKQLLFGEEFGRAVQYRGYSYFQLGERWAEAQGYFPSRMQRLEDVLSGLKESERTEFYLGFSNYLANNESNLVSAIPQLDTVPLPHKVFLMEAVGYSAATQGIPDATSLALIAGSLNEKEAEYFYRGMANGMSFDYENLNQMIRLAKQLNSKYQEYFWFSFAKMTYYHVSAGEWDELAFNWHEQIDEDSKIWFFRGLGAMMAHMADSPEDFSQALQNVVFKRFSDQKNHFFWGMGWGTRAKFVDEGARARIWISLLPEGNEIALEGLEAWNQHYRG